MFYLTTVNKILCHCHSWLARQYLCVKLEPWHEKKTHNKCTLSEDSDQRWLPPSLISVFAVRSLGTQGSKLS